jgi:hypothetical protein
MLRSMMMAALDMAALKKAKKRSTLHVQTDGG